MLTHRQRTKYPNALFYNIGLKYILNPKFYHVFQLSWVSCMSWIFMFLVTQMHRIKKRQAVAVIGGGGGGGVGNIDLHEG